MAEDINGVWPILSNEEKRLIVENFEIHHFKKNQIIYAENEEPEYLWCLLKGKVKKYKDGVGGRQQILRLIRPVQYFGYRAYFANEPYVSTSAAFEPSVLGSLPMGIVSYLITANNQIAWFFYSRPVTQSRQLRLAYRKPYPKAYPRTSGRSLDGATRQLWL